MIKSVKMNKNALLHDKKGIAATEFAMLLPIMILLFFGMLEASDALSVNRRISNSSNALADLVGQASTITPSEIEDIFTGVQRIIEPNDTSTLEINLLSVIRDPNDTSRIIVHWSRDKDGNIPYAEGAAYTDLDDETILITSQSLIVVELSYDYISGISNRVLGAPISFEKTAKRWPRRVGKVQLCSDTDPNDCTT